ncbi:CLUMA_CG005337, isoform A [Clunio marinus]|uniref:CLUMA_CG005337, isoform A n=1 Tax=Clunio marinus TaxID=568069 RepID=A0A1J1HVW4_9DIPT|nr:CLUMA_CG005337, isoform A [Clunio marinus]
MIYLCLCSFVVEWMCCEMQEKENRDFWSSTSRFNFYFLPLFTM